MSEKNRKIEFIKIICVIDGLAEGLSIRKEQEYYGFETVDELGYNVYTEKEKGRLPIYIGSYPKTYFQLVDNEIYVVTFEKNA
ncbi:MULTISPECIES: hypothetical protein [Priestia]|jgi:hypothetical protein|uniref:Uncharacterized protein n=1 Tax=Priestia megaterium TaxID=1404 RepID=A0ABD4WV54_PRIMG|nr:hypothetical protein [Priestia megaterium]KRF51427.1 hypothetical protein ASG98_26105 [Bacillus sp. Soil531]MDD9783891.1 hypothetical protein [Priestia megaterium]PEB60780.1 hypothetical protein COM86_28205 [Priestia megaterium]PEE73806.1 hypothetical protein COM81_26610 [Priestia megaterium]PFI92862.1 hypothetical protein COI84_20000 [Priestia megaterium]